MEFVGIVEDGYRDLKRLGLEAEITITTSVSIIERNLPATRKEWAKLLSSNDIPLNKDEKFSTLLKFLLTQKRALEYDISELRTNGPVTTKAASLYTATDESHENCSQRTYSKCVIHEDAKHSTKDCRIYLAKSTDYHC